MRVYQFRHSGSGWVMRCGGLKSDPGRDRTCDPRIKSPLLCQLSYGAEHICSAASVYAPIVHLFAEPASRVLNRL